MYNLIKKTVKACIPKKFLFKNELFFRSFYGAFYKGKSHKCNVCNKESSRFIALENTDLMCAFCGSLSRNRRLWHLLNTNRLKGNVLHFSPSRSLYRNLKKIKSITYFGTNFGNDFLADYKFDITNIEQPAAQFDTIICYHILEHIIDDKKAMGELYRVLKPNGTIYIQTPYKEGAIYEDYSITSPKDRIKHFGQFDHVRIYSIEGLIERLKHSGFSVEEKNFISDENSLYYGFKPETILILSK